LLSNPLLLRPRQVRFARPVTPGEVLRTEMWLEGTDKVIFQTRSVQQGGAVVIAAAVATIAPAEKIVAKL